MCQFCFDAPFLFPAEFRCAPCCNEKNQHNGAFRKRAWTLFGTYPDLDSRFLPGIYQVPWPSTAMRLRGCHWHDQGVPSPMFVRNSATQNIDLCILLSVNPSLIFSGLARAFSTFSCFNFVSGCSAIANVWDQDASFVGHGGMARHNLQVKAVMVPLFFSATITANVPRWSQMLRCNQNPGWQAQAPLEKHNRSCIDL